MEANCDVNQLDEEVKTCSDAELKAESCRRCDGREADNRLSGMRHDDGPCGNRPCGMRPEMNQCGNRPCGERPGMRPAGTRPGGTRPGGTRPGGMRPGGMRPGMRPDGVRPGEMRPGMRPGNRPCDNRPGMRPDGVLPDGWRPSDGMRSNSILDDSDLHSEWNLGNRTLCDSNGRSMKVGCEGQTMSGCHMNDPMDMLGDAFPPVMAFVPWQQWGDMYDPECGLKQGTVFKDLNYIFCGTRC